MRRPEVKRVTGESFTLLHLQQVLFDHKFRFECLSKIDLNQAPWTTAERLSIESFLVEIPKNKTQDNLHGLAVKLKYLLASSAGL